MHHTRLSVCLSVRIRYPGKTAEWIRMPLAMVVGIGPDIGVLNLVVIVEGEGQFWEALGGKFGTFRCMYVYLIIAKLAK